MGAFKVPRTFSESGRKHLSKFRSVFVYERVESSGAFLTRGCSRFLEHSKNLVESTCQSSGSVSCTRALKVQGHFSRDSAQGFRMTRNDKKTIQDLVLYDVYFLNCSAHLSISCRDAYVNIISSPHHWFIH